MKHVEIQFQGGSGKFFVNAFNGSQLLEAPATAWNTGEALTLARELEQKYDMTQGDHSEALEYYWTDANKRSKIPEKSRVKYAVAS